MKLTPADLDKALYVAARAQTDKDATRTIKRFMEFLKRRRLLHLLPKVVRQLPAVAAGVDEEESLQVESARPLSEKELEAVVRGAGLDPKKVVATVRIVPELLGGVRLKRKGRVVDATVLGRLKKIGKLTS